MCRRRITFGLTVTAIAAVCGTAGAAFSGEPAVADAPAEKISERATRDAYAKLPLAFVRNVGQSDARVLYTAQGAGYSVSLTHAGPVFAFTKGTKGFALGLRFLGTSGPVAPTPARKLPGAVNYLLGNDAAKWHTGVPAYDGIVYHDVWRGIDLALSGSGGKLKYELRIAPGARVGDARLAYRGADRLALARSGDLHVHTRLGVLRDTRPQTYQLIGGRRVAVESRFSLRGGDRFGFAVGEYDRRRPLVIDPGLAYSTYLGGSGVDQGFGIAVDATGNAYLTGMTQSASFPATAGAFDTGSNGGDDSFVMKLNAAGSALVYSTYLGGAGNEEPRRLAIDAAGNAYVTGQTDSSNFPTTAGAFDTSYNGGADAYVAKLNPAGTALVYSTYLGGSGFDWGFGIALDSAGNAYAAGHAASANFPTTPGAFDTSYNGGGDGFVTKLASDGSALLFSTYLGGTGSDFVFPVSIDSAGNAYVTGRTASAGFPTTLGAFDTSYNGGNFGTGYDAYVTKLNATGSALVYSTYLGGTGNDEGFALALDPVGNAYVTGYTDFGTFPTTVGAFDTSYNGATDAFVTKLNAAGTSLVYSTYLGGIGDEECFGIVVDAAGHAYVTGDTTSVGYPTTVDAFDTSFNFGVTDALVTELDPAGASLVYSTFLGGSNPDSGYRIALDAAGNAYVTGATGSANFPTTIGAFDTISDLGGDAFVTKLAIGTPPPATLVLSPSVATNPVGTNHTVTGTVADAFGNPTPAINVRFSVTGSVNTSDQCTTDASGRCSITYAGPTAPGQDAISAFADTDTDAAPDPDEPTGTAAKTWVAAAPATVMLSPPAATNPVGTNHTVTATVRDAFGNPTPSIVVRWSVSGSVNVSDQCATDPAGQCSIAYAGPPSPGLDAISAYADTNDGGSQDFGEPGGIAEKTWVPAAPATLVLAPATDTSPVGTSHTVTATLEDSFGNRTPGIPVRFSVTGSVSVTDQCESDANGQCGITYAGPTAPGVDEISAYADTNDSAGQDAGEPSGAAEKTWVPAAPATLVLAPATDTNPVGTSHTVTATLEDALGNRTPGITVRFSVTGANSASGSDVSNASGEAMFTYTGTVPGADSIDAYADTDEDATPDPGEATGTATKIWVAALKIAFASSRTGHGDIYVMNADGSGQTRLTTGSAVDALPAFSRDGTRIAFASSRTGNGDIYVINADGSGLTRLTTSSSVDGSPAFSPDGTRIAFASSRTGHGDIYVMNADGSGQTRLTTNADVDAEPSWSPDGTTIAFTSGRTGNGDVYVMNADGSGQTRLTTSAAVDASPDWSFDGARIAFSTTRNANLEIYVMSPNGSGQSRLTNDPAADAEPGFLADGRIAFTTTRDGNLEIYVMEADGSRQARLTRDGAIDMSPDSP
jgi:hypothetical protein